MLKRAETDAQKDEIISRLGDTWKKNPEIRLMQLISNVFRSDPYYIEDYEAMDLLEEFYEPREKARRGE